MLTRRELLRQAALASAAGALGCATGRGKGPGTPPDNAPEVVERSISELQRGMADRRWSAREITSAYLARIEALDRQGPGLRAFIEVNPDALKQARRLDEERAAGRVRGPLHGIPVALKDNIGTADRMTTTAGSLALEGSRPPEDSAVARRLRAAGAVLLGKANMSEWANIRSSRSSSGWSARGGQCRSPYALDRNPCGSSSGSAVAAAASLAAAAVGTETDGSIICPSSACGLVGLKPTVGLVGRSWIIPISSSQDTAGPMGRSVRDVALLLGALAGPDPRDPATRGVRVERDYMRFLDRDGLRGARIGVARELCGFHRGTDRLFEQALRDLERGGAELVDPAPRLHPEKLHGPELELLLYELKDGLDAYLAALGPKAPVRSLAQVIRFNEAHREQELRHFGQDLFVRAEQKGPLTEPAYLEARDLLRRVSHEGIDAALAAGRLDAIVAPSGSPSWKTDLVCGDHFLGGSSGPAAVAGYPNITVPAGQVRGLPVGISLFGAARSEPALLRLAFAFEQATQHRRPPRYEDHG